MKNTTASAWAKTKHGLCLPLVAAIRHASPRHPKEENKNISRQCGTKKYTSGMSNFSVSQFMMCLLDFKKKSYDFDSVLKRARDTCLVYLYICAITINTYASAFFSVWYI